MSILNPSTNEIDAVSRAIDSSTPFESTKDTARKALKGLVELRKLPSGTYAETVLELCEAVDCLQKELVAKGILDSLPELARYRIDLALVQARRRIQQMQEEPSDLVTIHLMQRVWANLYYNEEDAGNTFQWTIDDVVDWLSKRDALPSINAV